MKQETKDKISAANKGKKKPDGFGEMVAERNRKRIVSDDTRKKMRAAHARRKDMGLSPKPRRKLTDEEKTAISARVKKQWERQDRRNKQSMAFENRKP